MKKYVVYMLWDEDNGYIPNRIYLNRKSAEIALIENYTEYWILTEKAKIIKTEAVSYIS